MRREQPAKRNAVFLNANPLTSLIMLLVFLFYGSPGGGAVTPLSPGYTPPSPPISASPSERPYTGGPMNSSTLKGKLIVVDAGHGGRDFGTVGTGPAPEKVNVLSIAYELKALLESSGTKVLMTRTGDSSPAPDKSDGLKQRVALANRSGADLFMSVHNDWSPQPWVTGTTTYYYHATSARLADAVQNETAKALSSKNLGTRVANFYVVKYTAMPSVLVELGYLSNRAEAELLSRPSYRQRAARGLYNGIVRYFTERGF